MNIIPPTATAFRGLLFLLGPPLLLPVPSSDLLLGNPSGMEKQENYIIFGSKEVSSALPLTSPAAIAFSTKLGDSFVSMDTETRSVTVVGDINGDKNDDLMIGYPTESKVLVYLGSGVSGFSNMVVSFSYEGEGHDMFGWSIAEIGDINQDGYDDVMVCALVTNLVYVFKGQSSDFYSEKGPFSISSSVPFPKEIGFRIVGRSDCLNFGMAMSKAGDFNRDGRMDFLISAYTVTSQSVIFIIFGSIDQGNIYMQNFDASMGLEVRAPMLSFAGFSVAGIGDINGDGFADVAIGSLPYQGKFTTQRTYVVFGRPSNGSGSNSIILADWTAKSNLTREGFIVNGAGFLVSAVGDVNQDGFSDVMVTRFMDWNGSPTNAYLVTYPFNATKSPTVFPTSRPTAILSSSPYSPVSCDIPSNRPSVISTAFSSATGTKAPRSSKSPTLHPSSRLPTHVPSLIPSSNLTQFPTIQTSHPTTAPFHRKRTFSPTVSLVTTPTNAPLNTVAPKSYQILRCSGPGVYFGYPQSNTHFIITGKAGIYHFTGAAYKFNVYVVLPQGNHQFIYLHNFQLSTDIIDISRFPDLRSMRDLTYTTNPFNIYLSVKNQQIIIFPNYNSFDGFTERNFIFFNPIFAQHVVATTSKLQFSIILGVVFLLVTLLYGTRISFDDSIDEEVVYGHEDSNSDRNDDEQEKSSLVLSEPHSVVVADGEIEHILHTGDTTLNKEIPIEQKLEGAESEWSISENDDDDQEELERYISTDSSCLSSSVSPSSVSFGSETLFEMNTVEISTNLQDVSAQQMDEASDEYIISPDSSALDLDE